MNLAKTSVLPLSGHSAIVHLTDTFKDTYVSELVLTTTVIYLLSKKHTISQISLHINNVFTEY